MSIARATCDLSCQIAGVRFRNPLVLASGVLGTSAGLLERAARSGAGAVTVKSCGLTARRGHGNPTVVDWGCGLINAVGLPNPGAAEEVGLLEEAKERLKRLTVPLIASIFADTVENFANVAKIVSRAHPDLIELNISCPNVRCELGEPFAASRDSAAAVTRAVKAATDIPCSVKLAPNVPDIAGIARAVVEAGADAVTAINTMPGMIIDAESGQPVLANRVGGVSGPALKPIALRCVYEIAEAVHVPIIGTGGVTTGTDALEMLMAGATAVGIGSAVARHGVEVFGRILEQMGAWLVAHGYARVEEVRGISHRRPVYRITSNPPPVPSTGKAHG